MPGATLQVINTARMRLRSPDRHAWNGGATDASSGDRAWLFDFSAVTAAGSYEILDVERNVRSPGFDIGNNVYRPVLVQAVRTFFYQRAGHAKAAPFAGAGWADGASNLGPLQDSERAPLQRPPGRGHRARSARRLVRRRRLQQVHELDRGLRR